MGLACFRLVSSATGTEGYEISSGSHATICKCRALNLVQSTLPNRDTLSNADPSIFSEAGIEVTI
jgi:hypothetical protein